MSTAFTATKLFHLTKTLHLTLKMTSAQVASVANNSLSEDYPHPDDHARQTTDTPGFKPFTKTLFTVHTWAVATRAISDAVGC